MPNYIFNNNTDSHNRHEVHTTVCSYAPSVLNQSAIGWASDCKDALSAAKRLYPSHTFDGCFFCCKPCHKG